MQAAAAARRGAAELAAAFHSSAAALSKSTMQVELIQKKKKLLYTNCNRKIASETRPSCTSSLKFQFWTTGNGENSACNSFTNSPRIRFAVREKRADAKSALKNILLNGGPYQESSSKQMRKQKFSGKSKVQHSFPGKNRHSKNKCGRNWRNFDEDDCIKTPYGTFGGKRSFTWYWPGENGDGSSPSGFQWRDEPQSTKSREKFWNESDIDEEEESGHDNLQSHRISLGLPLLGPLKLDHIKSAFRACALKWHPDKHQGPSQAEAEEKFRRCVEAYNALTCAFRSSG